MRYSIIQDIFDGVRGQYENIERNEAARKLDDECLKLYDDLKKILNDEQKEKLEIFINKNMENESETTFAYYKEGLKIGLLLFAECLQD
ncbi:MAG: hypothetical protein K2K60_00280 [Clostridia bacterium]|nr:hypothetical protein [Clostridia bacterium]